MNKRIARMFLQPAAIVFVAIVLASSAQTFAQANLYLKWIDGQSPNTIYFQATCRLPAPVYELRTYAFDTSNVILKDNGVRITNFFVWSPDTTTPCPMSVALVLDANWYMSRGNPSGNLNAKLFGNTFVDLLDGLNDQGSVLWFSDVVNTSMGMTLNKSALHKAVNNLPAFGAAGIYDAIFAGIVEVMTNGVNRGKAVIVYTDSASAPSNATASDCMRLAVMNGIPIFIISQNSNLVPALYSLSDMTGGSYRHGVQSGFVSLYARSIHDTIRNVIGLSRITYPSACRDGSTHNASVSLHGICGSSCSSDDDYTVPRDPGTLPPLHIQTPETMRR